MSDAPGYQDLSSLPANGEAFNPDDLETSDYSDYEITPPGKYLSGNRKITFRQKEDGNLTFRIEFVGGLIDPATGRKVFRPDVTWASTKKFSRFNRPGQTSQVAIYLRAAGFDLDQVSSLQEAMLASENVPVSVVTGLEDKGKPDGQGGYTNKGLKTKDFIGVDGKFTPQVMIDGEVYTAKPRVQSFAKA